MRNFKRRNKSIFNKNISFSERNNNINYKKFIKLFLLIVVVIFIFVAFTKAKNYIYNCEKFQIQNIEITGHKNVTQVEIKELIPFKTGDNLFKVNLSDAENKIKILKPELKDITMLRRWKKILIKLKERQPEVFIMQGESLVGLDFDNITFGLRGHMFDMKIPLLRYSTNEEKLKLLEFVKLLKPYAKDFMAKITEVKFGDVDDIVLLIDGKTIVYWGEFNKAEIKNKFKKMLIVFEDATKKYANIEHIDLTFLEKDKILLKPLAVSTDTVKIMPEGSI
ncbi:hypothetical protein MASR1M68_05780 [Elusimicrobiota bacterium]